MNKLLLTLSFLISLICLTSQSWALPPCPKDVNEYWNNCYGSYVLGPDTKWSGDKYVGEWKDNKKHGYGIYTYGPKSKWSGDKYVGEHKDNKRNGQGTYTYSNGDKYVGEFKDSKKNGQGTYTYANGTIEEGIFKDEKFMYANKPTSSPNSKIERYKSFCSEIGFTPGTEKFGECVVEAMKKG